jgi:hypothetical protein
MFSQIRGSKYDLTRSLKPCLFFNRANLIATNTILYCIWCGVAKWLVCGAVVRQPLVQIHSDPSKLSSSDEEIFDVDCGLMHTDCREELGILHIEKGDNMPKYKKCNTVED